MAALRMSLDPWNYISDPRQGLLIGSRDAPNRTLWTEHEPKVEQGQKDRDREQHIAVFEGRGKKCAQSQAP
jgi:hypothetical protein